MATISTLEQLIEHGDYWVIPLQGKAVTRCFVDSTFGLECWDRDSLTTIRIEGLFVFAEQGVERHLSSEHPTTLGPALSVLGKTVTSAHAHKNGHLAVSFANGSHLSVAPDAEYEAWEIVTSAGLHVVCTPGGRLSIWHAARDSHKSPHDCEA
jgi:Family of unknown function (DUF6188)